jgi:hypothetical protein
MEDNDYKYNTVFILDTNVRVDSKYRYNNNVAKH